MEPIYTARAHVEGGRANGSGRTESGALDVSLQTPGAGGDGQATNPEELFAVGYAACFGSALAAMAKRSGANADDAAIDSEVRLMRGDDGFSLGVALKVTLPSVDDAEQAVELVRAAHQGCPYSKATRGNIEVTLSANGQPVG